MADECVIRTMTIDDYDEVFSLWSSIHGFGIRSIDDSREGVDRFLKRNPTTSVVALVNGQIVGAILCGHDGRRGCFYHVCVLALQKEHINKVNLIAFKTNTLGNHFWKGAGWTFRKDLNYYDFTLNEDNITRFNK